MKRTIGKLSVLAILAATVTVLFNAAAAAQESKAKKNPDASQLLPEDTVLFVQAQSIEDIRKAFNETSFGRMLKDEELQPMLGGLYGAVDEQYEQYLAERMGVSMADLPKLLKGEISFALAAPDQEEISLFLLIETGEENEVAQTLLEKGREFAKQQEAEESSEDVGQTKLHVLKKDQSVFYFEREGKLCICNNETLAKQVIDRWDGNVDKRDRSLAQNRKFVNVMSRCNGTKDEPPHIRFFIDPIEIYRKATRGNLAATAGLGIIRGLGLDGLSAIGASMIFAPEDFDAILNVHVLLASPRAGVIEMIAIKSGDVTPEPWVPFDVTAYMTVNWNVEKTYVELEKLYNQFQPAPDDEEESAFATAVQKNISDNIGVDLKAEMLDGLTGRISYASWYAKPARLNAQANMVGVGLKDPDAMADTLEKILKKVDERGNVEKKTTNGVSYYQVPVPDFREQQRERRRQRRAALQAQGQDAGPEEPEGVAPDMRTPQPCFGIVGDYLILTDSEDFLKEAIRATKDDDKSLANDPDYAKVIRQIRKQLDGKEPGMITYNRPEQSFRMLYDLAQSDNIREVLSSNSDRVPFFKSLGQTLEDNKLPDFEHLLKYMAPAGGMLINDESGIHYMSFSLRPAE